MSTFCKIGNIEVCAFSAGWFRIDGGAMFGVVPRAVWQKRMVPDERNRIRLGLTCLLIRTPDETVLVETGIGVEKLSEKMRDVFATDRVKGVGPALVEMGVSTEEVDRVVLTHLHMDHAGGATQLDGNGYTPAFPKARYLAQKQEWKDALDADRQTERAYYVQEDLLPLERAGVLDLVEGDVEVCPGVRVLLTPGHTRAHQSVLVSSGGETVCFIGDLVPTRHHLRAMYIMAFDLFPRETFLVRQKVLAQAVRENWLVVWPHDPEVLWSRVVQDEEGEFISVEDG